MNTSKNNVTSLPEVAPIATSGRPLTTREAASYLGISVNHLHKMCMNGSIPYYKTRGGKLSRYKLEDLQAWVFGTRVKTNEELEREVLGEEIRKGR